MYSSENRLRLDNVLKSLKSSNFKEIVRKEIEQLNPDLLPLQQGMSQGSHVAEEPFKAIVIGYSEEQNYVILKVGIFYSSIIAGCSCADDPTPVDINQEYCVLKFQISKETGVTEVTLLPES